MKPDRYKVIIIDDSKFDQEQLNESLKEYPNFQVVQRLYVGAQARDVIEKEHPDLLFLDMELPDVMGFDLLDELRPFITWDMKTVFYTAHDQYMINAIRTAAFDYLLKPFDPQELNDILTKFVERRKEIEASQSFIERGGIEKTGASFAIQLPTGDIRILKISEIGFFKFNASRRCWEVFLYNQVYLSLRTSVKAIQIQNFSSDFLQVHQSYIINISYLALVHSNMCMMYPPFNSSEIPISNKYRKSLQSRFMQF